VSAEACAELVRRGDPDRWRTAMLAPAGKRPGLMALYAFNLEIARAPWVTREAMLAEIRLRWWADAVAEIAAGLPPRRHEVAGPLAEAILGSALPRGLFEEAIEARLHDAQGGRFADRAALDAYLDRTAGHLMVLAARHLGADADAEPVVRCFAAGAGRAAYLAAVPGLKARGRVPLPADTTPGDLAREGLAALARARAARVRVPAAAAPALLAGWQAGRVLSAIARDPEADPAVSEARARAALIWRALTGRW
jgi:phytoene/squalene synthetase